MSGFVNDAEIKAHPHPPGERSFLCYCAKHHDWGEKGMLTIRLPQDIWKEVGFQLIKCPCGTWHIRFTSAQDAENIIKEERYADFHQD